jgi:hypothetical protein
MGGIAPPGDVALQFTRRTQSIALWGNRFMGQSLYGAIALSGNHCIGQSLDRGAKQHGGNVRPSASALKFISGAYLVGASKELARAAHGSIKLTPGHQPTRGYACKLSSVC